MPLTWLQLFKLLQQSQSSGRAVYVPKSRAAKIRKQASKDACWMHAGCREVQAATTEYQAHCLLPTTNLSLDRQHGSGLEGDVCGQPVQGARLEHPPLPPSAQGWLKGHHPVPWCEALDLCISCCGTHALVQHDMLIKCGTMSASCLPGLQAAVGRRGGPTLAPTDTTSPTPSWPGTPGSGGEMGYLPWTVLMSEGLMGACMKQ